MSEKKIEQVRTRVGRMYSKWFDVVGTDVDTIDGVETIRVYVSKIPENVGAIVPQVVEGVPVLIEVRDAATTIDYSVCPFPYLSQQIPEDLYILVSEEHHRAMMVCFPEENDVPLIACAPNLPVALTMAKDGMESEGVSYSPQRTTRTEILDNDLGVPLTSIGGVPCAGLGYWSGNRRSGLVAEHFVVYRGVVPEE